LILSFALHPDEPSSLVPVGAVNVYPCLWLALTPVHFCVVGPPHARIQIEAEALKVLPIAWRRQDSVRNIGHS